MSYKILCLLGDIKNDPSYWERAWKTSHERCSRAMRSLGMWYYRKGEYQKSVNCYKKALAINSLVENAWFSLGCAAVQMEDWETARLAFAECVVLEPGNAEAWNNLAAIHIKCNRSADAFRCLKEGLKEKYDSWKMWENFLTLSLDLCQYAESLNAFNRLFEIKWSKEGKKVDEEALCYVVHALIDRVPSSKERDCDVVNRMLISKAVDFLRKIGDSPLATPVTWRLLAEVERSRGNYDAALVASLSMHRLFKIGEQEIADEKTFQRVCEATEFLVQSYLNSYRSGNADALYQARIILRKLLKLTKVPIENNI